MPDLQIVRSEIKDANAFVVRLIGRNRIVDSRENARKLCQRMHDEGRAGLIMDYRQCSLDHTLNEFGEVATVFAENLPKGLRVAYVYSQDNFMHAALMTKQLHKAGFPSRAVREFDDAVAFLREGV